MSVNSTHDGLHHSDVTRALVVWFIANPVSGGGRGKTMLSELAHAFCQPVHGLHEGADLTAPVAAAGHSTYHVHQFSIGEFMQTPMASHLEAVRVHGVDGRPVHVFLLSTEGPGQGVRVAEYIARDVAAQRLAPRADATPPVVHVVVPIGGDGTLSEVVNGVCRGAIAAFNAHATQQHGGSGQAEDVPRHEEASAATSRSYYFRVLEEKSALRYLAPALLYMPTGTGADFAKLNVCAHSVSDCVTCLERLADTLHTSASSQHAHVGHQGASNSKSRVLAFYEVDVGRLTFPRTGRVHFFMNECSFGMSCDVIERAEQLRRTRWMSPLGGTVLFATASALSLLFWRPKDVRVLRLPAMPTLPSWRSLPPITTPPEEVRDLAVVEEVVMAAASPRARASVVPPAQLMDPMYAQQALALDRTCCARLRQQTSAADDGDASMPDRVAQAIAEEIRTQHQAFQQDQAALEALDYYAGHSPRALPSSSSSPSSAVRAFKSRESAPVSANSSFTRASGLAEKETDGTPKTASGMPVIGMSHPLFFRESGAPRRTRRASASATTTDATVEPCVVAQSAETIVYGDAKHVQRALDLPERVLARSTYAARGDPHHSHHAVVVEAEAAMPSWVQFASSTISFGIGRWFGGGLHITPHADPADGLLSATSWHAELIPFVSGALSLYNGRHVRWSSTAAFDGARFVLDAAPCTSRHVRDTPHADAQETPGSDGDDNANADADASVPLWMEADGELVEPLPAVIELAGVLTFLVSLPPATTSPLLVDSRGDATPPSSTITAPTDESRSVKGQTACQPLRFGPPVVGTTRAADWHACEDLMRAKEDPLAWIHDATTTSTSALASSPHATGRAVCAETAALWADPVPEYIQLYVNESQRWPPQETDGFFGVMAKSSPKWRLCCGTLDHLWRLAQNAESCTRSRCGRWMHHWRAWWCRGRREREEETFDGRPQRTRALQYPSFSARTDTLV